MIIFKDLIKFYGGRKMNINVARIIKEIEKHTEDISMYGRGTGLFLTPYVQIRPHPVFPGFYLDNLTLYEEALEDVEFTESLDNVIKVISYIYDVFGKTGSGVDEMRLLLQGKERVKGKCKGVSIDSFVGKNIALSCEKASFLHNCLKILGYEAYLIFGYFKKDDQESEVGVAYNVAKINEKFYLIDSCHYIEEGDKTIPNIFEISVDDYDNLIFCLDEYVSNDKDHYYFDTIDTTYVYS